MAGETTAQVASVTGTNQVIFWTPRYNSIVITNPSATVFLYVTVDGSPAVAAAGAGATNSGVVPPGQTVSFQNSLPFNDITGTQTVANLLGAAWQAFSGSTDGTHMTQVNIIGSAAGPTLATIEVQ